MGQEEVRKRLQAYLNSMHIKQKYVSIDLGIEESVFSRYLHGTKRLYNKDLELLENYLTDRGY